MLDHLHLPAGAPLFSAGDPGQAAYLIQTGCLEIYLAQPEGDLVLARRGPGEIVGEMAILDRRPRATSVRAIVQSTLLAITEDHLNQRISEIDPILRMCLGVVVERYRETIALLGRMKGSTPPPITESSANPVEVPADFTAALERLALERDLRGALERSELELFFQPIVRLRGRRLAGFEALLRWRHPERGMVPPAAFIPVAEASGLISELTRWVLDEVGRVFPGILLAALDNQEEVEGPLFMSVNVTGHDLAQSSFPQIIADMLQRTGIPPSNFKLEVTESTLMKDPEQAAAALATCRAGGMGIAIDDFGTGYSSLSYLNTLPITTLKIDRAFVRNMLADPTSRRIVKTILRLADELGIPVVAEGVEQGPEADALAKMGCDFGQGWLFGKAVPLADTIALVRNWTVPPRRRTRVAA